MTIAIITIVDVIAKLLTIIVMVKIKLQNIYRAISLCVWVGKSALYALVPPKPHYTPAPRRGYNVAPLSVEEITVSA